MREGTAPQEQEIEADEEYTDFQPAEKYLGDQLQGAF